MKPENPPPAEYHYGYVNPPPSGNVINGVGEDSYRPPKKIVPDDFTITDYDYKALFDFFFMNIPWPVFREFVLGMFESRKARGKVAEQQRPVTDTQAMAKELKEKAVSLGVGIVGITEVKDELLLYEGEDPYDYRYAICLGTEQDRSVMKRVPQPEAGLEVVSTYRRSSRYTNELAAWIRSMGWRAEAFGVGRDILMIPSAIEAGLGELGKHGNMVSKEFGSNFRLSMVLTDLPLATDQPVDIGLQDVCITCQACTRNCPPGAISDQKSLVRGVEKWYVDYDKCSGYFVKTVGCSICMEVCPWSEEGRGVKLSELMLSKRNKE